MAKITEIMLLQQVEQNALVIEKHAEIGTFSNYIGEGFMKIGEYLDELGEMTTDIPFVEYPGFEQMDDKNIRIVIGNYTAKALPAKGDIQSITIPARKIAVCLHRGTYDALAELYNEMMEWIKSKGYEATGASIEHYYTGPEVPESEQVTRIVMPLK